MSQVELDWREAARAHLQEASKKHRRLGKPKSRTGCLACKLRRVKCDEGHPECNRCVSSGRLCPGYARQSPSTSPSSSLSSSMGSPIDNRLAPNSRLQDDEKRQLDFFISRAAPRLAGAFDKDFWCGSVLQAAQHEPVILDCLLAISTLYEHPQYIVSFRSKNDGRRGAFDLVQQRHGPDHGYGTTSIDANHERALTFYNRAIKGFKQHMNDGTASPTLALVSCILFVCVETIRDNVNDAMHLYARGIGMLNQYSTLINSGSELALLTLVQRMFLRVGVQAATFGQRVGTLLKSNGIPSFPSFCFEDVAEAREELFTIVFESNSFTLDSNVWREAVFETRQWREDDSHHARFAQRASEIDSLFTDLKKRNDEHTEKLIRWRQAFEPLCNSTADKDIASVSYLLMIYCTFTIWMPTKLSHRKTAFDGHTSKFRELVHHAENFLRRNESERPVFTFDIGAISSLFYVAWECRVPSIRRKATALLRQAPKKEGILGADGTIEIAIRIISIEERGLGLPDPANFDKSWNVADIDDTRLPEEEKRVHFMEMVNVTRALALRVTMLVEEEGFFHWRVEDVLI